MSYVVVLINMNQLSPISHQFYETLIAVLIQNVLNMHELIPQILNEATNF